MKSTFQNGVAANNIVTETPRRREVKVSFINGDHFCTAINGTEKSIRDYYKVGKVFNIGLGPDDNLDRVKSLEFLD